MLNPVITASDGAFDTQEGCLSLTGERRTLRYRRIEVNYENRRFRARHATFTGWTAQIIQHEVDHCNGNHHLIHSVLVAATPLRAGHAGSSDRCNT